MSNAPAFMAERRLDAPNAKVRTRKGPAAHLRVACIMDEFSYACFSPEAEFLQLTPADWRLELSTFQPDLLFIESAWRGKDGKWWNTVPRCGPELQGILAWCRERGVPTAFWNKEDPVHFRTFLTLAREFDACFTTDVDMIPHYRAALGHDAVYFLPFAAQPLLHNPLETFDRIDGCAFAGAYYRRYPSRTQDLHSLSQYLSEKSQFHIYDRNFGQSEGDYAFPDEYRDAIVGGLEGSEIEIAYKGYTSNLNLNSVKESQTMFARRVFELMASNTTVISNFSKGLRTMFGDLTFSTDSAQELERRMTLVQNQPDGPARLKAMALRKVMREHTYEHRLSYVASRLGVIGAEQPPVVVGLVARIESESEAHRIVEVVNAQTHSKLVVAVLGTDESVWSSDPRITHVDSWDEAADLFNDHQVEYVGMLNPSNWYGPHYVEDLALTLGWADVECAGFGEHYALTDQGLHHQNQGAAWQVSDSLASDRCLVVPQALDAQWLENLADDRSGLAVHAVGFCAGADESTAPLEVRDVDLSQGESLEALRAFAASLSPVQATQHEADADLEVLAEAFPAHPTVKVEIDDQGSMVVSSDLEPGQHAYAYSEPLTIDNYFDRDEPILHFVAAPGLDIAVAVLMLDSEGQRVAHAMATNGKDAAFSIPDEVTHCRFGMRVMGPGSARIERFTGASVPTQVRPLLLPEGPVVVTNVYPDYDNLYRNGFVHSRVRSYRERGLRASVVTVHPHTAQQRFREFENVDTAMCSTRDFAQASELVGQRHFLVHFLDRAMWAGIRAQGPDSKVTIWIHGAEVQPWWRREYNYHTDEELAEAKVASEARLEFWREVFRTAGPNVHFVFVSQYFADEVMEDVGVELSTDRYSIIHNPIDGDVFRYVEKRPNDRFKVLSIRPYASAKYANDLSVKAVLDLVDDPIFKRLQFTFIGDGPMFDEILEPLHGFSNVAIERRFLSHPEVAEQHRQHGVFLTPTRMDAQGVSRDEAMASGLVPVTTDVAAVPEFVDDTCGFMAPLEDHEGLAEAIRTLATDGDRFLAMSKAAAERVRRQSGKDAIVTREIELISR